MAKTSVGKAPAKGHARSITVKTDVSPEEHRAIKHRAIDADTTVSGLLRQALGLPETIREAALKGQR